MANLRSIYRACKDSYGLLNHQPRSMPSGWQQVIPRSRRNQPVSAAGHSAVAYYNPSTQELVIAHRGSRGALVDWVNNAQLPFRETNASAQDAITFSKDVMRTLATANPPAQISHIYQAGHSKGGYEAQVCTATLSQDGNLPKMTCVAINAPQIRCSLVKPPPAFEAMHIHGNKDIVHVAQPLLNKSQHLGNSVVIETAPCFLRAGSNHSLTTLESEIGKFDKMEIRDLVRASELVDNKSTLARVAAAHVPQPAAPAAPASAPAPAPAADKDAPFDHARTLDIYRARQTRFETLPDGVRQAPNGSFGDRFGGVKTVDDWRDHFTRENGGQAYRDPSQEEFAIKHAYQERQDSLEQQARAPGTPQFDRDRLTRIRDVEKADFEYAYNRSSDPRVAAGQDERREQTLADLARHDERIGGPRSDVGHEARKEWVSQRLEVNGLERGRRELEDLKAAHGAQRSESQARAEPAPATPPTPPAGAPAPVASPPAPQAPSPRQPGDEAKFVPPSEQRVLGNIHAMRERLGKEPAPQAQAAVSTEPRPVADGARQLPDTTPPSRQRASEDLLAMRARQAPELASDGKAAQNGEPRPAPVAAAPVAAAPVAAAPVAAAPSAPPGEGTSSTTPVPDREQVKERIDTLREKHAPPSAPPGEGTSSTTPVPDREQVKERIDTLREKHAPPAAPPGEGTSSTTPVPDREQVKERIDTLREKHAPPAAPPGEGTSSTTPVPDREQVKERIDTLREKHAPPSAPPGEGTSSTTPVPDREQVKERIDTLREKHAPPAAPPEQALDSGESRPAVDTGRQPEAAAPASAAPPDAKRPDTAPAPSATAAAAPGAGSAAAPDKAQAPVAPGEAGEGKALPARQASEPAAGSSGAATEKTLPKRFGEEPGPASTGGGGDRALPQRHAGEPEAGSAGGGEKALPKRHVEQPEAASAGDKALPKRHAEEPQPGSDKAGADKPLPPRADPATEKPVDRPPPPPSGRDR